MENHFSHMAALHRTHCIHNISLEVISLRTDAHFQHGKKCGWDFGVSHLHINGSAWRYPDYEELKLKLKQYSSG